MSVSLPSSEHKVRRVRLKIDIGGTIGDAAWKDLRHFSEILGGVFGPEEGSSGSCEHAPHEPHRDGEWCGALIEVENHLLAEYAVAHYLEQSCVIDAYEETE
ncbi:MAG: hypothetical protein HY313_06070 [Acidobacteria bacterium]|nr:hypothetical protein [Acidobacteriota bacterium]